MAFLGQIFGGGNKDDAPANIDVRHYDNGGNVAPLNTIGQSGTNQLAAAAAMQPQAQAMPAQMQPGAGANQFVAHPGQTPGQVWGNAGTNYGNQLGNLYTANGNVPAPGANALGSVMGGAMNAAGQVGGSLTHLAGDTMQGIGSAFTAQNQYNAGLAPTMQSDYSGVIQQSANNALNGYGQYLQNQGQQQNVANQLQNTSGMYRDVANGVGPNPAQAMLNQQTGQNVANQAALMAGQRGAGSNVGLMARQAAMQGANTQQQAVGQGATMQANQQLAGLAGLQGNQIAQGQLYGQMGNQVQGQQNVNAGLFSNAAQAQNAQNNTNVSNYGMMQGINSQVAQNNANAVNKTTAGLMGGAGSLLGLAEGGEVPSDQKSKPQAKFFSADSTPSGGVHSQYAPDLSYSPAPMQPQQVAPQRPQDPNGPRSFVGNFFKNGHLSSPAQLPMAAVAPQQQLAKGGMVDAMVSPGEKYLTPKEAAKVAKGEVSSSHVGKIVPGTPKFKGNNYANDVVPAKLEAGGIVIPNSVMQSKNPEWGAHAFVKAHLAKNKGLKRK